MSKSYRGPQSASPLYMNRRHEDDSDSNDEMEPGIDDFDEDDLQDYHDQCLDNNPHYIIDNEMESDSLTDTAPTAPSCEEVDGNLALASAEDLRQYDLKDLIYKLFLNIYNSEDKLIEKLKKEIFPRINENTQLDNYITHAISSCMDHVKDELQSYIKKNLKCHRKKSEAAQKSMINNPTFVPFHENVKEYTEIIDKIIDFYDLFHCSIDNIVDVWRDKLGHIQRLPEIFDYRHKKLFSSHIWQDKEIFSVIELYFKQNYNDDKFREKLNKLSDIGEKLSESMEYSSNSSNQGKKSKKGGKKNKNKPKKKKSTSNVNAEQQAEKLYEISDIDELCKMIESSNDHKKSKSGANRK